MSVRFEPTMSAKSAISTRARRAASALLLVLGAPSLGGAFLGAETIQGRALRADKSFEAVTEAQRAGKTMSRDLFVPLADADVVVARVREGGGSSERWPAHTGEDGRFSVEVGASPAADALYVVSAQVDGQSLYSTLFAPGAAAESLFLFATTESRSTLDTKLIVIFDLEKDGPKRSLHVRARLYTTNTGPAMYIGQRGLESPYREVARIPVPPEATLTVNKGPVAGLRPWRRSQDGRWLILDTPIPGILDPAGSGPWDIEYVLAATQRFSQAYPLSERPAHDFIGFLVVPDAMSIDSKYLEKGATLHQDPLTDRPASYDPYVRGESGAPARSLPLTLHIDNVAVGDMVNYGALLWVGSFVALGILALSLGFLFGPKSPPLEAALQGLGGRDLIDRIVALDRDLHAGKITAKDHERLRAPLVALAAEELSVESSETGGVGVPARAQEVLRELDALPPEAGADRRLLVLEELAAALRSGGPS